MPCDTSLQFAYTYKYYKMRRYYKMPQISVTARNMFICLKKGETRELKKWRRRDDNGASHPRKTGSKVWYSEGKFEG